tara:strand:+ start:210 stop:452 length:243 start_codon:yes stop_codon:yes gene_type:complete
MKAKEIKNYLVENYGECRHDENKFEVALKNTAITFELNEHDLFLFIVEGKNHIGGTMSYGFQTRYGREIRRVFKGEYYGE